MSMIFSPKCYINNPLKAKLTLKRKYDVCSCLSQSEDLNTGVLSVKTEFMEVYERVAQEDHRYLTITIFKYGRYTYHFNIYTAQEV